MSKVALETEKWARDGLPVIPLKSSLPFYQSRPFRYWHRVRSATMVMGRDRIYWHTAINLWCGANGFVGSKKSVLAKLSSEVDGPICAICEAKAIGAGLLGASVINGREVIFTPRRPCNAI